MKKSLPQPQDAEQFLQDAIRTVVDRPDYELQEGHELVRDLGMESIDLVDLYFQLETLIPREKFFACLGAERGDRMSDEEWKAVQKEYELPSDKRAASLWMHQFAIAPDDSNRSWRLRFSSEMRQELLTYETPPFSVARLMEIIRVQRELAAQQLKKRNKNA